MYPGSFQHATDSELVAAVLSDGAAGADAFDAWYRREHPIAYRLCFGILLDPTDAEDAAQDAILRVFDNLRRFDPARAYGAWRNAIVANLCRDRLRSRSARRRLAESVAREPTSLDTFRLPDPQNQAAAAEVLDILVASLSRLTPREREVFVLKDLEQQSTPHVASALGVTQSSVRSLLTLARRRLRGILEHRLPQVLGSAQGPRDA